MNHKDKETLNDHSEGEDFIPVLEFDTEIRFPKNAAKIDLSIYADGHIMAKLGDTDIAAEASSIEEAIAGIKLEIEEEYHYLKDFKDGMSNHVKKQLDIIKKLFE